MGTCGRFVIWDDRDVQDLKIPDNMYVIFEDWGCLPWSRPRVMFDVQDVRELRLSAVVTGPDTQARYPALNSGDTCDANRMAIGLQLLATKTLAGDLQHAH